MSTNFVVLRGPARPCEALQDPARHCEALRGGTGLVVDRCHCQKSEGCCDDFVDARVAGAQYGVHDKRTHTDKAKKNTAMLKKKHALSPSCLCIYLISGFCLAAAPASAWRCTQ